MTQKNNFPRLRTSLGIAAGVLLALGMTTPRPAQAINFNFTIGTNLAALQSSNPTQYNNVVNGFNAAANLWQQNITTNVTVTVTIDYAPLGAGILGSTGSSLYQVSYANFRTQLAANSTSANDAIALANLPVTSVPLTLNRTSQNGNSATTYLDNNASANNTNLVATGANLKALGFTGLATNDASITFSSNFGFDFDRSNGINGAQYDFIGIAAHEIGHALGFVSAVDSIDNSPGQSEDTPVYQPRPLDLFRFSAPGVRNIAADNNAKYFSLNNGTTNVALFSNGTTFGDGSQASHWKDNLGIGIMDPTAAAGELLSISNIDRMAFDAIGYSVVVTPEASTFGMFGAAGLTLLVPFALRRRRKTTDAAA